MYVIKRDNRKESVFFDKITSRLKKLSWGLSSNVDLIKISQKVCAGIYKGVTTTKLDELAAETAASLTTTHPDYGKLAARICVSNLHKNTSKSFSFTMESLYSCKNNKTGKISSYLSKEFFDIVKKNSSVLDSAIIYDRDFEYDYFGMKTLERAYLLKIDGKVVERPQHMLMRVSIQIHKNDIDNVLDTYNLLSLRYFIHATPTLFNSGTRKPQLSSCYLLSMREDSIEGIYDTLKQCALISKYAGGIGLSVHKIRSKGSEIIGTNGISNGLVPMLKVYNNTARYVDQGGGKRKGSIAIYIEPWHFDIFDILNLKKNHGHEESRTRDLFYALWVPDLFMKRVKNDDQWSLFCPNDAPNLYDCYGNEFEKLYEEYEKKGYAKNTVKARKLWNAILSSQIETGTPYMLYKDACNMKSNQKNLGTIKLSNLCAEIIEYCDKDEIAVCNLASISLPIMVNKDGKIFDHDKLHEIVYKVTINLNKIIDTTYYPLKEAKTSNIRHRPIGIGVQGLADAFMKMRYPFESKEAKKLNIDIFETIYFAGLTASKDLAKKYGPYESYKGSPASKGILQFDMWNVKPSSNKDWNGLKEEIKKYGLRNSLLIAVMPTASTSQILGHNEAIEPYTSNLYIRRVLAGEYICINRHLLLDLLKIDKWNPKIKNKIIADKGSVQNIDIPQKLKDLYKCVWEISQKTLIDMAVDRGAFIDQSQSFNVHMKDPSYAKLTSMHFYGWENGLKTGMYYLRTKAAVDAIQFTVEKRVGENKEKSGKKIKKALCSLSDKENCMSCGA